MCDVIMFQDCYLFVYIRLDSAKNCGYAASLGQRKRVAHIPTAQAEAARSGLIFDGQGQARVHLKSKPPWSHQWGPVQYRSSGTAKAVSRRSRILHPHHGCVGDFSVVALNTSISIPRRLSLATLAPG